MFVIFYSLLAAGATVLGGGLPLIRRRMSEKHLTLLVAFSAGVLLSTGLNHMVVESYSSAGRWAMVFVSLGFMILYGYEKMAMIHACREQECEIHHFGQSALFGMGFHSFLDGFAIAVSLEFERTLGVLVLIAVLLHRLPTGISTSTIMLANKYNHARSWITLGLIGGLAVVGAVSAMLMPFDGPFYLSLAVGLSGGTFLYIATSDLLPLAHENYQDYRVPLFFLAGFLAVLGTSFFNSG